MVTYALRRLLVAVPMLLGAMSIVFFAMRILPGDPCVAMMGDQATTEALADCTKNLGLHRPLAVQYVDYIWRSVQFDFGKSLRQGYPVSEYIARMFPHTLGIQTIAFFATMITIGDVRMSDGETLEHKGLVPDEIVLPASADLAAKRDPLLARAIALLGGTMTAEEAGRFYRQ